jgi:hypothetical protein
MKALKELGLKLLEPFRVFFIDLLWREMTHPSWGNRLTTYGALAIFVFVFVFCFIVLSEDLPTYDELAAKDPSAPFTEWQAVVEGVRYPSWDDPTLGLILDRLQQKAQRYEEWMVVYNTSVGRGAHRRVERLSLEKLLETAQTYEQAKFVYKHHNYHRHLKGQALNRMANLTQNTGRK